MAPTYHVGMQMPVAPRYPSRVAAYLLPLALVAASGCNLQFSTGVEARDTWTRTYKVKPDATLELKGTNGKVNVTAVDGDEIQLQATRVAKGSTDEAAKAALADVKITEQATADRVSVSSATEGVVLNFRGQRVDYDVKVPRGLQVVIRNANGDVHVAGVAGMVRVEVTNGRVEATGLEQGVEVDLTNGEITAEFTKVGESGGRIKCTNGEIRITLPAAAKATLAARIANGEISTPGLTIQASEESRRRLDATVNGGGPEIRVESMNGTITFAGR
jgi:DUF4097 and DUF4098 domain-containing protein YvlB